MDRMATHDPTFCDITWGAGGTTADLTLEIAGKMQNMVRHKFVTRRRVLCGMQQQPATPEMQTLMGTQVYFGINNLTHLVLLAGLCRDNDAFDMHQHASGQVAGCS